MSTETFNLPFASSISSTLPWKFANGPSSTSTISPIVYNASSLRSVIPICFKMKVTSSSNNGVGFAPPPDEPINPVTPGVLRTTYQESSVIISSTKTYPGNVLRITTRFLPSLKSVSCSSGIITRKIKSDIPIVSTRFSRFAFTLFSYPEYV